MQNTKKTKTLHQIAKKHLKAIYFASQKEGLFSKLKTNTKTFQPQVEVHFVDDKLMKQIHFQAKKKKTLTDILSFPFPEFFQNKGYLGELIICISVLEKQSKRLKHPISDELNVLLTHGFLHLLGYDHEKNSKEALKMKKLEAKLLQGKKRAARLGLIERSVLG